MLGDKVKIQPMDTMEKNGRDADDVGSGWLEVKKKHRSNTKLAMPKSVGASRVRSDTLRKVQSDVRKGSHTLLPGPVGQSSSNIPVSPGNPQKIEDGVKNASDTKLMPGNKHSEHKVHEQSFHAPEEKIVKQSVENLLQFGKIEHSGKPAANSLEKVELKDMAAFKNHVSDSCIGRPSIVNHEIEVLNQSILGSPFTQVPKIKWGNLDEDELEQTQPMGTGIEQLKPQNSDDGSITEDNMPLARSALCVISKENSSVMQGNSRVSEDEQEYEICDARSNNSEISKRNLKEDDFMVSSGNIIGGSESCVQQLHHKSSNVEDFSKAPEEGSIHNESVKCDGCGNQLLLTLDEAEGPPIQETTTSCIENHHNSLETTMPNKVFVTGEYIQESISSIDNSEGRENSSEKSCRTELIHVTRDTAQSKEDPEVIESTNDQVNREKFDKDMSMAANMLINAYEKGETGESKERFRQRLWCFLFENLNRAIDELYLLCELECDVEQMKEAGVVLEEALSDFKELKSRVEGFDKVENLSSTFQTFSNATPVNAKIECRRPHALSWEVRRMTSSPHRAEILSSSLEVFKKIQEESAIKNVAHQGKRRDTVYPLLAQIHRENLPGKSPSGRDFGSASKEPRNLPGKSPGGHDFGSASKEPGNLPWKSSGGCDFASASKELGNLPGKSPGGRDFGSASKEPGAKLKGKQVYSSESVNQGSMGEKKHIEVTKLNRENSTEAKMAQKNSHLTYPQLTGKKEGNILTSNVSSSKFESCGLSSEMNFGTARRSKLPSSEILVDKNNKLGDPCRRQVSIVDKEKEKKPLITKTSLDAWKEKRNWGDVLASPLRSSSRTIHSPIVCRKSTERVRVLHDKLMSPERRRKSPLDMKKDVDEKHARATRIRRELENERAQRLQRVSEKLNRVSEWQAVRSSKLREGMHARQQRGESRHEAYLAQIARRASDESSKVSEVRFITSLNEENKKLSLQQKLHDSELRRAERLQIIKIKQKEDIAREEAVLERRKLLEAEKLQRLAETQRKKEEAQARREEERKAASAAREAKAVEQVRKKEVRAKAQKEEAELQAQKLAERLRESELRRKLYLEQIRERAAMDFREQASPSSRRPPSRDGQARSVVNQTVDGYLGNTITGLTGFALSSSSNLSQQQSLKKRVKKIRQRLMARKYEFVEPPVGAESTGLGSMAMAAASRSKIGRWLQDLQRLQQTRKAGATSIGLIIGEMIKYLEGKEAELHAARQAGLIDFVASALPASHTSKPEACQTTISLLRIVKVMLALAANCSYFLARNLLPPLIPMLSTALENYCTIAASNNSYSGVAGNSISTSSDKISDEKLETIGEVLQGLLWSIAAIMAHPCSDERQLQMQDDMAELIVACKVIHNLRDLFSLFDRPQIEGAPFPAPVLLGLNLLRILTCPRGNISSMDWEAHSATMARLPGVQTFGTADYEGNLVSLQGSHSNKCPEKEADFSPPQHNLKDTQISDLIYNTNDKTENEVLSVEERDRLCSAVCEDDKDIKQLESVIINKTKVRLESGAGGECTISCALQKNADEIPLEETNIEPNNPLPQSADDKKVFIRKKSVKSVGAMPDRSTAFLVSVIAETGLVGLPSLLTAILLQANPRSNSEQADYVLPFNFEEVATVVLKIMNNLARLDLMLIQNMLARPDLQMEFFHLMSFLLSHCTCKWKTTTDQVALVLFETLLLLGYFALLHSGNQAVLRWGKSPTILHKICDLPFAFFSDPQLTPVLVGTLLAVCYGCEQNRNVVQQELSMDMLLVLLKSSKQDISTVSDSRQTVVPRIGVQLDAQSNSLSYQSGTMDVIAEESEEEMQKILGKDHGFISQDVSGKPSGDSPVADIPGNSNQQPSGRPSKTHVMSSDHSISIKRSNRTVNKTVYQGELSLKESVGTRTNSLGKNVKGKPIGANKEIFTHQAKGSKVSNPDIAQKISAPVSSKRGISVVLPDHKTNSSAGIQLREFKYPRDYQDNPLLSPAFMLHNRFPVTLIDRAQEFFAAGLDKL